MATIAMAYGDAPYTTAFYLHRAFEAEGHQVHVMHLEAYARRHANRVLGHYKRRHRWISYVDAGRWLRSRHLRPDLFLWVESPRFVDVAVRKPFPCPSASWVIDTNVHPDRLQELSSQYDFPFVSQKEGTQRFEASGLRAEWLPLAADPLIHRPQDVPIEFDIGFVGRIETVRYRDRYEMIRALSRKYKVNVATAYGEEMAKAYSRCRIAFNKGLNRGLNMRVFEVMAIGRPLVTDLEASGILDMFEEGKHFAGFGNQEELFSKVERLLGDPGAAGAMANVARAEVMARHTYVHRARKILETVLGPSAARQGAL